MSGNQKAGVVNVQPSDALADLLAGEKGTYVLEIGHDAWCDRLAGRGACNCQPNAEVKKPTEGEA